MKLIKSCAIICFITLSTLATAAEVVLSNGDTIHGQLIENSDGQIKLLHPSLGLLTLTSAQIRPAVEKQADKGLLKTGLLTDWTREVEAGIKGSEGNSRSMNVHLGTRLRFEDSIKRWDIEAAYNSSEDGGNQSRNDFFGRFNRDFLIANASRFYFAQGRYDWDEFEEWDYRLNFGGGAGSQLIKTDNWTVNGRAGLGISKTFGDEESDWIPEGVLNIESNWAISKRHSLEFKNNLYPSLKEAGEFRNISNLNWRIGLAQLNQLDLKVGLRNEFDSNAPAGSRKNDFRYHLAVILGI